MIQLREARMAMDYLTGVPVTALAAREELSLPRVYQLLDRTARRVLGLMTIKQVKLMHMEQQFAARLHDMTLTPARCAPGDTPEGFFHELNQEYKTRNYS